MLCYLREWEKSLSVPLVHNIHATTIQNLSSTLRLLRSMADYRHHIHELEEIAEWEEVNGRRTRRFVERTDPFALYSDKEFLERYRLSKVCVQDLLRKYRSSYQLPITDEVSEFHQNFRCWLP
ncbi:hypothetical protein Pcinc_006947 [Petrolisthes cinctipes]|uniref:Uncharacterized protein n=1 Tax=Petrolisthes cinctipes TaxID=88211 RepID=A0AAE1KZ36_PETCI|nr:hypothetical protein Pcinc_006947 [Petrolisthes cinctipes]